MYKILLGVTFFFCMKAGFAQSDSSRFLLNISVIDTASKVAVKGANVVIYDNNNSIILSGSTGVDGDFKASFLSLRYCVLSITCYGYLNKTIRVTETTSNVIVHIDKNVKLLDEVEIVKKKNLVNDLGDKLIYYAENDLDIGGDATDVLRKVPLVSVDANGNPSLKSNPSIKILVNGRASNSQNSALILKMIPSSQISKIEVITAPSAKYEAEGVAGIINIITKSQFLLGANGVVNVGGGSKGSHILSSLYYNKNKINVNISYGANLFYNKTTEFTSFSKDTLGTTRELFTQNAQGKYNGNRYYSQFSANYSFTENDLIGLEVMYSGQITKPNLNSVAFYPLSNQDIERKTESRESSSLGSFSTYYDHKFTDQRKQLSMKLTVGLNSNLNSYNFSQVLGRSDHSIQEYRNNSRNKEFDSQIDYQMPLFRETNTLEVGIRYISRLMNSSFSSLTEKSAVVENPPPAAGLLNYNQSVYAGYLNNTYKINHVLSLRAGTRFEMVRNTLESGNDFYRIPYSNFFPSGGVTWKLASTKTLSLNYSYRIKRPSIQYLNPAYNTSEILVRYSGNPYLEPEYANSLELGYSTYIGDSYVKITSYFTKTNNSIGTLSAISNNGIITSYNNMGNQVVKGLNLWISLNLVKGLTINNNFDILYKSIRNQNLKNSGYAISETFNVSYNLSNRVMLQYFGNYYSSKIELQGKQSNYSFSNLAIKCDFDNKKYSLALSADNPFRNSFDYNIRSQIAQDFNYVDVTRYFDRGFRITFNYNFGKKHNPKVIERRKEVDDLKSRQDKSSQIQNNNN